MFQHSTPYWQQDLSRKDSLLMTSSAFRRARVRPVSGKKDKRDVKKVPFLEMFDHRLQGIVSSGSDIQRVYVSYFDAKTLSFGCSTNNNRPCGGLGSRPCNHLKELMHEAVIQFGLLPVVQFLQIPADPGSILNDHDILGYMKGLNREYANTVFSRFLGDLELLELPSSQTPFPAMTWFTEG
jgi:hypothetical protein